MRYAVVIEKCETGYGAYVPDLPGCVAVSESGAEVRELVREAIAFHLDGLRQDGEDSPSPAAHVEYVDVPMQLSIPRRRTNGAAVAGPATCRMMVPRRPAPLILLSDDSLDH